MGLTPEKILEEFHNKKINKPSALHSLISFIENSDNDEDRIKSLNALENIDIIDDSIFKILENIVISDVNATLRNVALNFIGKNFLGKSFELLKWVIIHERDYQCKIKTIKLLEQIKSENSKLILYNEIKKIIKLKYLNKERKIENKKFKKILKKLLREKEYGKFTHTEFAKILINYLTLSNLFKKYNNVYYELDKQSGLIIKLDLSDYLEYEVKGTPWKWKNNINKLSEIPGLKNLHSLQQIDLSNNQITDIKEIIHSQNLTHLILTNNNLRSEDNLLYLKNLPNLLFLDLRGNYLINKINLNDFRPQTRVLLRDTYLELK
jgi:Leucine-rich repeat (LRR) protein